MGPERRNIWDRTDPSRCGLTCSRAENISSSEELLERLIEFALNALDLHSGVPFGSISPKPDFSAFKTHFTTIFTDVRLNTKGMTLELRTPDSRPMHLFREAWITFQDMIQRVMDDESPF
jgi:glutamate--cysteine ligase